MLCYKLQNDNYDNDSKEKVFRFPKNKEVREKWLKKNSDNTPDSKNTVVCQRNWPKGHETMQCYDKLRLRHSPSVFTFIKPLLQIQTLLARLTMKTSTGY